MVIVEHFAYVIMIQGLIPSPISQIYTAPLQDIDSCTAKQPLPPPEVLKLWFLSQFWCSVIKRENGPRKELHGLEKRGKWGCTTASSPHSPIL